MLVTRQAHTDPVLRLLQQHWLMIREGWFEHEGKEIATADEVRALMKDWMDHASNREQPVVRYWRPLSAAQKEAALLEAFPDRDYCSGGDEDVQYVVRRLKGYAETFDGLFRLLEGAGALTPEAKQQAQGLLKALKDDLEYDRDDGQRRGKRPSNPEKNYFYPAVAKALAAIRVKGNTDPISSHWVSELDGARASIMTALRELDRGPSKCD
jgi:hypothetical protein